MELLVGITTWNSELFLERCLKAVRKTTASLRAQISIVDNMSTDRTIEIARDFGAEVHMERCSQSVALNRLLSRSNAKFTLLLHSDVILLSDHWYQLCSRHLVNSTALVSPEDVGCGPMTRPYGQNMPESSFMLFDTALAKGCQDLVWIRRRGIPWPTRRLDFDGDHVTHHLPFILARHGYHWHAMTAHASPLDTNTPYRPSFTPEYWSEELETLRYAMGNFYSLDGHITHYHNWFDRVPKDVPADSIASTEGGGKGIPVAFLSLGTQRFIADYDAGKLVLPDPHEPRRMPRVVERHVPNLTRPYS